MGGGSGRTLRASPAGSDCGCTGRGVATPSRPFAAFGRRGWRRSRNRQRSGVGTDRRGVGLERFTPGVRRVGAGLGSRSVDQWVRQERSTTPRWRSDRGGRVLDEPGPAGRSTTSRRRFGRSVRLEGQRSRRRVVSGSRTGELGSVRFARTRHVSRRDRPLARPDGWGDRDRIPPSRPRFGRVVAVCGRTPRHPGPRAINHVPRYRIRVGGGPDDIESADTSPSQYVERVQSTGHE